MNRMSLCNYGKFWSIILIASSLQPLIVDAKRLPRDKDQVKSAYEKCLKIYIIEEDFVPKWLEETLSYGEKIEEFCKDKNAYNVEEKMRKYSQKNKKIGEEIKTCIKHLGVSNVYDDYYSFGDDEFNASKQADKLQSKDDKRLANETSERITLEDLFMKDNESKDLESATSQSRISEDQKHQITKDEANKKDILNLSKFILGMCHRDKALNFDELEELVEKRITTDCLHRCVWIFTKRIYEILDDRKEKIRNDLEKKGITSKKKFEQGEIEERKFPNEARYVKEKSRLNKLEATLLDRFHSSEARNPLMLMGNVASSLLENYSEMYSNQNKYLSHFNIDDKPTVFEVQQNQEITVDYMLSHSFVYCKGCAKRECFMKKFSIPVYNYMYDAANGRENKTTALDQRVAAKSTNKETQIPGTSANDNAAFISNEMDESQRYFFKLLIREDNGYDDDDGDDDPSSNKK